MVAMKHHGSMHRTRAQARQYTKYRHSLDSDCQFCSFTAETPQVIAEHTHFWIVENIFPYKLWDDFLVEQHLMIVPKRHVVSLIELTDAEKFDYITLIADYEHHGYSIYSRTDKSLTKSIPHQHTHLIRVSDVPVSRLYYQSRPHILVYRERRR